MKDNAFKQEIVEMDYGRMILLMNALIALLVAKYAIIKDQQHIAQFVLQDILKLLRIILVFYLHFVLESYIKVNAMIHVLLDLFKILVKLVKSAILPAHNIFN